MTHLLHVDASPRRAGSLTRELSATLVARWSEREPGATVTHRDLADSAPPFVSAAWIQGAFSPPDSHADEHRLALRTSDVLLAEVQAADVLVLGMPVYNFSVPAAAKAWIDQVVRVGRTFAYDADGPRGLLTGTRAVVLRSSGTDYTTPDYAPFDFQEPYLRGILGFIGVTDVEFVSVSVGGGGPEQVDAALADGARKIEALLDRAVRRAAA